VVTGVLAVMVGIALMVVFLSVYRAEGLLAFYLVGIHLVLITVDIAGIPWSTVMTGSVRLAIFFPLLGWWWMSRGRDDEVLLPRRWNTAVVLIIAMLALWQCKHYFELQYLAAETHREAHKWAYVLQSWGGAFILGFMMPLTLRRLRRFLGAMGFLGVTLAAFLLVSFLMGRASINIRRYSPFGHATALGFGQYIGIGIAGLLGWLLLCNELKRSQKRILLVSVLVGLMAVSSFLTASRGPMVSLFITIAATLILMGGRRAMRLGLGMIAFAVILYLGLGILPEPTKHRLFGTLFAPEGASYRMSLLRSSLEILKVAPFLGQTVELTPITGFESSHNLFAQILIELGLVGVVMFAVAFIPAAVRWLRSALRWNTSIRLFAAPLYVFFTYVIIARSVAGNLFSTDFWMAAGILMGHQLVLQFPQVYDSDQWLSSGQYGTSLEEFPVGPAREGVM